MCEESGMNPEEHSEELVRGSGVCPVTGLRVTQKTDWVDVEFGEDYRVTLCVLGGCILHSRPRGHAGLKDVEQVLAFTRAVSEEVFGEGGTYVQIEDYAELRWASLEARRAFIRGMKDRPGLAGVIFCHASPLFKMSVKLARLLTPMDPEVHLEEDLSGAVWWARQILSTYQIVPSFYSSHTLDSGEEVAEVPAEDLPAGGPQAMRETRLRSTPQGGRETRPEWTLELEGFWVRYERIERDLIYTVSEGLLTEEHIAPLFAHMESVLASMDLESKPFFSINQVSGVRVANLRTRRLFMEKSVEVQSTYPFRLDVYYGGGLALRAAIRLARPFVPFRVALADDFQGALDLVSEARARDGDLDSGGAEVLGPEYSQVSVEEVLRFLGSIDWESEDLDVVSQEVKDPSHPLNPLFESVCLIKNDLDRLLREKEEAVRALEIERAYLSQLFDNSQLAMARGSSGGVIQRVNRQFTRMFGYTVGEVVGRSVDELIVPEGREEEAELFTRKVEQGSKVSMETVRRHKDGTLIPVEALAFPILIDGRPVGAYSMYLDIRERVRAERELRESEERHRSILENMNEGYYEADLEGNLTFVNRAMSDLLGYSKEELMGMNYRRFTPEENVEEVYGAFNRVYRAGLPDKGFEWETIRKDGSRIVVDTSVSRIRDEAGKPIGFRGLIRDVTERKRAREEREELRAQLQHAQRMEAIGTLAGGIAHNFNNLLMGVQGNASLIGIDLEPGHPHYARVKAIERLVKNGSDLTRQLLGYAREGKYEASPIDLNSLVRELAETFGAARKEIRIHTDLWEPLSPILADRGQIGQALMNIMVNAVDAMPKGGDLYLTTRNVPRPELKTGHPDSGQGDHVLLSVRDTGVGMDDQTRAKIFEPFFTTKGLSKGTGLGLASVYGIVKAHGGHIRVNSEPGSGTTFEMYFPATEAAAVKTPDQASEVEAGTGSILLVDDEKIVLDVGAEMLSKLNYTVWKAEGGTEAVRLFEENHEKLDLVILDMIMPDMGGGEVYDRIKVIDPRVKVLLASGYNIDGKAAEILDRGCDDFIQKPFDMKELSAKVTELLNRPGPA